MGRPADSEEESQGEGGEATVRPVLCRHGACRPRGLSTRESSAWLRSPEPIQYLDLPILQGYNERQSRGGLGVVRRPGAAPAAARSAVACLPETEHV
jgi:hypothetical protein